MKTKLLLLVLAFSSLTMMSQVFEDYWQNQDAMSTNGWGSTQVNVVNADVVWLLHTDFNADPPADPQAFSVTTDGGSTWTEGTIDVGDTGSGIAMISAISATTAWVVAHQDPNTGGVVKGIFKTTDGGATWNRQDTALYEDAASFPNVVYFWDENHGFAQGDPVDGYYELYLTDDGGDNWTRIPQADIPDPIAGEFGYTGQIFVTGDSVWWTTNYGRVYRNNNRGVGAWEVYQSEIDDFGGARTGNYGEISFHDANHGYLLDSKGGNFYTTDNGGETWNFALPIGSLYKGAICAIPGTNAIISTGSSETAGFGSSFSVDGGQTFTDIYPESPFGLLDVQFIDLYTGYAGSFKADADPDNNIPERGGVYKWISNVLSGADNLKMNGFVSFPNPVVDVYHMGAKENISDVSVYNMMGQLVYAAKPSSLTHDIDMSNLPNGTYIINVTVNGTKGSMKVIK